MGAELALAALTAYGETIKLIPNYDQRRREKYEKLLYNYKTEIESDDPDSRLVYEYHTQLCCFFKELKAS